MQGGEILLLPGSRDASWVSGWDLTCFSCRGDLSRLHPSPRHTGMRGDSHHHTAGPDVAQTLWKRETLSTFWLGTGFKKGRIYSVVARADVSAQQVSRAKDFWLQLGQTHDAEKRVPETCVPVDQMCVLHMSGSRKSS